MIQAEAKKIDFVRLIKKELPFLRLEWLPTSKSTKTTFQLPTVAKLLQVNVPNLSNYRKCYDLAGLDQPFRIMIMMIMINTKLV